VIRESGGDRSAVTGGTRVLSDRIVIRITADKGAGFLDKMIALVEGARRQKTPNEIALTILLAALTFIFLLVCVTLKPFGIYSGAAFSIPVLVALLVCLIPTTIGGLLSAIGIAGMDRVLQRNVLAMSGRAVEAAGDVDVLLLDKTGTITLGNRMAVGGRNPGRTLDCRACEREVRIARAGNARTGGDIRTVYRADTHERCRSSCQWHPTDDACTQGRG
jgi:K+-transporting ATPase ATPase B chain